MANHDMYLSVRIAADAARYAQGLTGATQATKKFSATAKEEFNRLKSSMGELRNQLAMLGIGFAAMQSMVSSAKMDKGLTQIGQTANMSKNEVAQLRGELFQMASMTGQKVEDLQEGFNNAVQAGLNFKQALPVTDAVNKAMAVTGASAQSLTGGLTVAAAAFQFDLAKPNEALTLLDKMTVAGRLGNAELEDLSGVFSRVGQNAMSAGMGFDKTLGFIESLSQIEKQPERLATLADSTLRVFTNRNYMMAASKATGVSFFNKDKSRRDAVEVMQDLKKKYDKLKDDESRSKFVQAAFGKADQDTIKGMKAMFSGKMLADVTAFADKIKSASGTLEHNLPDAINNAADATGRLKATLTQAADGFTKPIRDTFTEMTNFALDKKENGGLGLDGKDLLLGGAGIAGTALAGGAIWRMLRGKGGGKGGALPAIMGEATSLGKNIAVGKTLQTAAGVTPVYVVNMPDGMGGGGGGIGLPDLPGMPKGGAPGKMAQWLSKLRLGSAVMGANPATWASMGAGTLATGVAAVGAAGAAGYGAGTLINKGLVAAGAGDWMAEHIGGSINKVLALFGNEEAQRIEAINNQFKNADLNGTIKIELSGDRADSARVETEPGRNLRMAPTGRYMPEAG